MNMGTPVNPEGLPHWSNTAMFSHKLEGRRRRQQGFWLFFREDCGRCDGSGFVENILADVTSVKREEAYGGFRPDVLLERGNKPTIWLEFTHTSPPSESKLAYCASRGIDVFELDGSQRPLDSFVRKAHISPRNCREQRRRRLNELWERMEDLDDPVIGIREDFRSPMRKHREREEFWVDVEEKRKVVENGMLCCARCDRPFAGQDRQFSVSYILSHSSSGACGEVPFCRECSFEVHGGWDGVYPEDADSWGLHEGCDTCEPFLTEYRLKLDKASQRRTLLMPESYGSRLVQEPEHRPQEYIVGDRSVSRDELQSILMMFKYILVTVPPPVSLTKMMLKEVDRIEKAVQYANNMRDWDWLEGIGESYVPEEDAPDTTRGDKFLCPKRWWPMLPPCPLTTI